MSFPIPRPVRHIIGCICGTSMDAVDAALVRVEGNGLDLRAQLVALASEPLGPLAAQLRRIDRSAKVSLGDLLAAALALSDLHAEVVARLRTYVRAVDFVAAHGQTVFHRPPLSLQLLNAPRLAQRIGLPVIFDLRAADLAAGGQGAPITPIADYVLFRHPHHVRVVLNLGGFCNFTRLPATGESTDHARLAAQIVGGDICACNHVLDGLARRHLGTPFDLDGAFAASGTVIPDIRDALAARLSAQADGDRSLGTADWLEDWEVQLGSSNAPHDLAASACAAIATTIARRIESADEVLLAGGGARNQALLSAIQQAVSAGCRVVETAELGWPVESREAAEMAILGALSQDRVSISLPQITKLPGSAPVAGSWAYP